MVVKEDWYDRAVGGLDHNFQVQAFADGQSGPSMEKLMMLKVVKRYIAEREQQRRIAARIERRNIAAARRRLISIKYRS